MEPPGEVTMRTTFTAVRLRLVAFRNKADRLKIALSNGRIARREFAVDPRFSGGASRKNAGDRLIVGDQFLVFRVQPIFS
jgi:hypothetical protein